MTDPSLGVLLFIPYRSMEQRILAAMQEAGYHATLSQARVFQRIADEGSRLTDLAEAAQVTKQTAGFLVDQLERAGFVERVPDPADGRARLIRVTAWGREGIEFSAGVEAAIEAEWEAHLGTEELERLRATLLKLREITDPWR